MLWCHTVLCDMVTMEAMAGCPVPSAQAEPSQASVRVVTGPYTVTPGHPRAAGCFVMGLLNPSVASCTMYIVHTIPRHLTPWL